MMSASPLFCVEIFSVLLEESFGLYQEGMGLMKLCNENIDHVEKQMLQIDEEGQTHEFS